MKVTAPFPTNFLFPSISQHVWKFKTKLCLSLSNHKKHLKNVWAGEKHPPFTCSADSEMSEWNLSWEQAWRITEQVVIVFSKSEMPEICTLHQHSALFLNSQSTSFSKWSSPWLRVPHLDAPCYGWKVFKEHGWSTAKALLEWEQTIQLGWLEFCYSLNSKLVFSKDQGCSRVVCMLEQWCDMAPELMVL